MKACRAKPVADGLHRIHQYTVQTRNDYVVRIWENDKRVYPYRRIGYFNNYVRAMPRFRTLQSGLARGSWKIE